VTWRQSKGFVIVHLLCYLTTAQLQLLQKDLLQVLVVLLAAVEFVVVQMSATMFSLLQNAENRCW